LNRKVPRSEVAKRVSHYDAELLSKVATKWFWDKEISIVVWGPCHHFSIVAAHNRIHRRSTLGWLGTTWFHTYF